MTFSTMGRLQYASDEPAGGNVSRSDPSTKFSASGDRNPLHRGDKRLRHSIALRGVVKGYNYFVPKFPQQHWEPRRSKQVMWEI